MREVLSVSLSRGFADVSGDHGCVEQGCSAVLEPSLLLCFFPRAWCRANSLVLKCLWFSAFLWLASSSSCSIVPKQTYSTVRIRRARALACLACASRKHQRHEWEPFVLNQHGCVVGSGLGLLESGTVS